MEEEEGVFLIEPPGAYPAGLGHLGSCLDHSDPCRALLSVPGSGFSHRTPGSLAPQCILLHAPLTAQSTLPALRTSSHTSKPTSNVPLPGLPALIPVPRGRTGH